PAPLPALPGLARSGAGRCALRDEIAARGRTLPPGRRDGAAGHVRESERSVAARRLPGRALGRRRRQRRRRGQSETDAVAVVAHGRGGRAAGAVTAVRAAEPASGLAWRAALHLRGPAAQARPVRVVADWGRGRAAPAVAAVDAADAAPRIARRAALHFGRRAGGRRRRPGRRRRWPGGRARGRGGPGAAGG